MTSESVTLVAHTVSDSPSRPILEILSQGDRKVVGKIPFYLKYPASTPSRIRLPARC